MSFHYLCSRCCVCIYLHPQINKLCQESNKWRSVRTTMYTISIQIIIPPVNFYLNLSKFQCCICLNYFPSVAIMLTRRTRFSSQCAPPFSFFYELLQVFSPSAFMRYIRKQIIIVYATIIIIIFFKCIYLYMCMYNYNLLLIIF